MIDIGCGIRAGFGDRKAIAHRPIREVLLGQCTASGVASA